MRYRKIITGFIIVAAISGSIIFNRFELFKPLHIELLAHGEEYQLISDSEGRSCFASNPTASELSNQTVFRLVGWNIHKQQDDGWQADLQRLSRDSDFVLLQESLAQNHLPSFSTALFVSSFAYQGTASGVMTLSRIAPSAYCVAAQSEPFIRIPKVMSATYFPLKSTSLLVINVHLINFEFGLNAYSAQFEKMAEWIKSHSGPLIIAGDFNMWNEKRVAFVTAFMRKYGLTPIELAQDFRSTFNGYPLDHIFARGISPLMATSEALSSSDHNPLILEFEVK